MIRGKEKQKRCSYSKQDVISALSAINSGITVSAAANKYNIPRSTLVAKKYQKYSEGKPGPSTVLIEGEENGRVQSGCL